MAATFDRKKYAREWRERLKADPEKLAAFKRRRKSWYESNKEHCQQRERERYVASVRDTLQRREQGNTRAISHAISQYKSNAKRRDYEWRLTDQEAEWFLFRPCYYCGISPSWGMDRFDNAPVYDLDTVVPCCKTDNIAKGVIPLDDYLAHLQRVTEWRTKKIDDN